MIARAPTPVNTSRTRVGAMSESMLLTLARVVDDLEPVARFAHEFAVGPERAVLADPKTVAGGEFEGGLAVLVEPGEDDVRDGDVARDADHGTGRGGRLGLRVLQPLLGVLDEGLDVGPGEVDGGLEDPLDLEPEVALVVGMGDRLDNKGAAVNRVGEL